MIKKAWLSFCRQKGFVEYHYSNAVGFHASAAQAATGQRIPWGKQGDRRSSMFRNVAKGHIWQFGVTAMPYFWPFWHLKFKSRVVFSVDNGTPEGLGIDDARKLHRLRRRICKGWRNKQWHGRMLAFLELLSSKSAYIRLSLAANAALTVEAAPKGGGQRIHAGMGANAERPKPLQDLRDALDERRQHFGVGERQRFHKSRP